MMLMIMRRIQTIMKKTKMFLHTISFSYVFVVVVVAAVVVAVLGLG